MLLDPGKESVDVLLSEHDAVFAEAGVDSGDPAVVTQFRLRHSKLWGDVLRLPIAGLCDGFSSTEVIAKEVTTSGILVYPGVSAVCTPFSPSSKELTGR